MCDTFLCHKGRSVFIELKTTKNNSILLQKSQIAWNMSLFYSKGLSFFLVKHLLTSDLFLFEGCQAIDLSEKGLLAKCQLKTKDIKKILEENKKEPIGATDVDLDLLLRRLASLVVSEQNK